MARKRRKKKSEKEIVPFPPEAEVEEITEEETIKEEMIEEYKDYVKITKHEPVPFLEPVESPPPTMKKIKYLGVDILIMKGPVTGQRYRFTAKDRISEVAIEDYEGLLKKVRRARKCCGRKAGDPGKTVPSQPYFGPV